MVFSDEDKILIKSLYLKGYTAKRLTDKFPEKSWTKRGVNKLLKKLRDTGTVDRRLGSRRLHSARTEENVETVNDIVSSQEDKPQTQHSAYTVARGIKIGALKCNLFAFSSISAEYLQKI